MSLPISRWLELDDFKVLSNQPFYDSMIIHCIFCLTSEMAYEGGMDKIKGHWKVLGPKREKTQVKNMICNFVFYPLLWKVGGMGCETVKELVWRN